LLPRLQTGKQRLQRFAGLHHCRPKTAVLDGNDEDKLWFDPLFASITAKYIKIFCDFFAWVGGTWRSRNRSLEGLEISIWYRLLPVASHKYHIPNHYLLPSQQNMLRNYAIFVAG
jgi:hypothetical protein